MKRALRTLTRRGRHIPIAVLGIATLANTSIWPVTAAVIAVLGIELAQDLADRFGVESCDDLASARDLYVTGEIPLSEFERRVEMILDDDAQQIRAVVEEVHGVGPETSAAIASRFPDVDALEVAPREDLEDVPGVGEATADALVEHLRGSGEWGDDADDGARPADESAGVERDRADVNRADRDGDGLADDLSPEEIRQLRELADRALDPDDDSVSLADLESVPRDALQDGDDAAVENRGETA